ncbi:MAG: hypothetical protein HY763_04840 [Planctomycetes bacterium]|nr:hypothetical protein [Planctomycetota bacterium]
MVRETNYPGAKVTGFAEGRLQFRTATGELQLAELADVDVLLVDRGDAFADFNQAERLRAAGDWENAIPRYQRALRVVEEFWPDVVTVRLLAACDGAARLDEAVLHFIRVTRSEACGPAVAAGLMPRRIPQERDATVVRAIEHLDTALAKNPPSDERSVLELLRYDVLRRCGDRRADTAAKAVVALELPKSLSRERVYEIMYAALEMVLAGEADEAGLRGLDRSLRLCPLNMMASFLLLKGRTLLRSAATREDVIRAAWPFMRVVAHMPGDARAAEGLLGAATALERLERKDKALELLHECLAHKRASAETREAAKVAIERLQAPPAPGRGGAGAEPARENSH